MTSPSVFVSEAVCGGAWRDQTLPPGLLKEGHSMWTSLLTDLAQQDGLKIVTTCDDRIDFPVLPGLTVHPVQNAEQEQQLFFQLAEQTQATLAIAPEIGHMLEQRVQWLNSLNKGELMSTPAAIRLASDKWAFYELCLKLNIPTPLTWKRNDFEFREPPPAPFPWFIKPQFGAGASNSFIIENKTNWESQQDFLKNSPDGPFLIQPFVTSTAASMSVIVNPASGETVWFPPGRQNFLGVKYQGGTIPCFEYHAEEMKRQIHKVIDSTPGFRGYLGFDFLITPPPDSQVLLLELNPRLSTSYLGYRQLSTSNLTCWMIGTTNLQIEKQKWKTSTLNFTPSGDITFEKSKLS